jgi:predicted MFS family arabinose efflux permease
VFASHQIGAAAAALAAGLVRDASGTYTYAWWGGAALCTVASVVSMLVRLRPAAVPAAATNPALVDAGAGASPAE